MKKKLIYAFAIDMLEQNFLHVIHQIVTKGYQKTGNKFTVLFSGSKGYLDGIHVVCEGVNNEKAENRIAFHSLLKDDETLNYGIIKVVWSEEFGAEFNLEIKEK